MYQLKHIKNIILRNNIYRHYITCIFGCVVFLTAIGQTKGLNAEKIEYWIPSVSIDNIELLQKIDSTLNIVSNNPNYWNEYNSNRKNYKFKYIRVDFSSARYVLGLDRNAKINLNDSLGTYILIYPTNRPLPHFKDTNGDYYFKYNAREYLLPQKIKNVFNAQLTGRSKRMRLSKYLNISDLLGVQYIFLYKDGQMSVVTDEDIWFNVNE